MKKLFVCAFLAVCLFAVSSVASAAPLYEEDFLPDSGGFFSANWYGTINGGSNAAVFGDKDDPYLFVTFGYDTPKVLLSTQSFDLKAGETYTFTFDALAWTRTNDNDLGFGLYVGGNLVKEMWNAVETAWFFDDQRAATTLEYTFVADADMTVQLAFIGKTNTAQYEIYGAQFDVTAATPIPGAIFLLAPGVAGLAALRKRIR